MFHSAPGTGSLFCWQVLTAVVEGESETTAGDTGPVAAYPDKTRSPTVNLNRHTGGPVVSPIVTAESRNLSQLVVLQCEENRNV